jgi:hypothetical protein
VNPKAGPATNSASELRELRRHIAAAGDEKILQIVRMMDTLEQRGASDALLAPVRPRLAAMKPSHKLRFTRLLFMPADPLIVARDKWRPDTPAVPRVALPILANFVRGVMGGAQATTVDQDALVNIDRLIEGATTADADIVRAAGLLSWPRVATALKCLGGSGNHSNADLGDDSGSALACATAWREAGLPAASLEPIASGLAAMLETAPLLDQDAWRTGAPGHSHLAKTLDENLAEKLAAAEAPDMQAWGMLFSLLLIRLPEQAAHLLAAPRNGRLQTEIAERAAEFALVWATPASQPSHGAIADGEAATLRGRAALLDTLVQSPGDPGRRRRAAAARAELRETSWAHFSSALQTEILAPVHNLPKNEPASDERTEALEAAARRLHGYERSARTLGGGPATADIRHQLQTTLRDAPGLSPMDRARLLELMGDTAAAVALLDQ